MVEIITAALLGYVIVISVQVFTTTKLNVRSMIVSSCYLAFLCLLAVLNFEYDIFAQKFASEFAFDVFKGRESLRSNSGFWLQSALCAPAFWITGAWWSAIGTNIALMSGLLYYVHNKNPKWSWVLLAPAVCNFAMFALRDPIIGALAFILTVMLVEDVSFRNWVGQGLVACTFLLIRPENLAIFAYAKLVMTAFKSRKSVMFYISFPALLLLAIVVVGYVPRLLGLEASGSLADLPTAAADFYDARATRYEGGQDGGGSNILGGRLYSMPIVARYPIQVFTFFVLPLPFEVRSAPLALAFIDSVFFCLIAVRFHLIGRRDALIVFWVYVLAVAFFSTNYGNVFRIRLPAYFIMLAGLIQSDGLAGDPEPSPVEVT